MIHLQQFSDVIAPHVIRLDKLGVAPLLQSLRYDLMEVARAITYEASDPGSSFNQIVVAPWGYPAAQLDQLTAQFNAHCANPDYPLTFPVAVDRVADLNLVFCLPTAEFSGDGSGEAVPFMGTRYGLADPIGHDLAQWAYAYDATGVKDLPFPILFQPEAPAFSGFFFRGSIGSSALPTVAYALRLKKRVGGD